MLKIDVTDNWYELSLLIFSDACIGLYCGSSGTIDDDTRRDVADRVLMKLYVCIVAEACTK